MSWEALGNRPWRDFILDPNPCQPYSEAMVASTHTRVRTLRPMPTGAFSVVIKAERNRRGWNQREMGQFLLVSQSCIARWETRSRAPSVLELTRIGRLLGITWTLS